MNEELLQLILDTVTEYSNTTIRLYRVNTKSVDLYGETDTKVYHEPLDLQAVYWHFKDDDNVVDTGRESMDYVDVTLPIKAIIDAGILLQDIKLTDFIEIEGRTYGIQDLRPTGRAYGDHTILFIRGLENPDLSEYLV